MRVALVAIAKNEAKGIREWLAYHVELGFDDIVVYDNESTDSTATILDAAAEFAPVRRIEWPSEEGISPQVAAYNDFLQNRASGHDWVAFFDLDEFLVLRGGIALHEHLAKAPADAGALGINWVTFGSSGQRSSDYESVIDTFRYGPKRSVANNYHIKSMVRPEAVRLYHIHRGYLEKGSYYHPSFEPLKFAPKKKRSKSYRIDHSVMHLNHYQIKSLEEFDNKISRGRAGVKVGEAHQVRKNPQALLFHLDRMEARYNDIDARLLQGKRAQALLQISP